MASNLPSSFPVRNNDLLTQRLTLITGVMMTVLSAVSIIFPEVVYLDRKMVESFLANDLVNIIIGLPIFLISIWLINRERYLGWMLLPGALIYVIYNYLAYFFSRPFDLFALVNLGLVLLSSYTLFIYLRSVDHHTVKEQLKATVPIKIPAWVLIIFGAGFFLLACYQIIDGLIKGTIPPPRGECGLVGRYGSFNTLDYRWDCPASKETHRVYPRPGTSFCHLQPFYWFDFVFNSGSCPYRSPVCSHGSHSTPDNGMYRFCTYHALLAGCCDSRTKIKLRNF